MDDETKATLAAAIAGGYILGRTKKGRLALTAMTLLLGRRWGLEPQQLVTDGVRRLREVPQVAELEEQVRTEGIDAARHALTSVVGRGVESVTGGISSRLPGADGHGGDEEQEPREGEERGQDKGDDAEPEESSRGPARHHRRAPEGSDRPSRTKSRTGTSKSPGSAAGTADRAAKKTPAKRAAPAKKAASSTARKASSSPSAKARRTARSAPSRPSRPRSED
jgi:hypothetical protein